MIVDVANEFENMRDSVLSRVEAINLAEKHVAKIPFHVLPDDWSISIYTYSADIRFPGDKPETVEEFKNELKKLRRMIKPFSQNSLDLYNITHLNEDKWAVAYSLDMSTETYRYLIEFVFWIKEDVLLNAGLMKKNCYIKERTGDKTIICGMEG